MVKRFGLAWRVPVLGMFACAVTALCADGPLPSREPLHAQIDRLIEAAAGGPLGPLADDAEFLRRVSLDFAGRIPASGELRAFLADTSPDKRARSIDRLLADSRYVDRMTDLFSVMLLERRGEHPEWQRFLRESFAANRPWDRMVRDIVAPNADDESARGAAYFYTVRLERYGQNPPDVEGLVRDIGRMFLGVDVQCAQCHDHLFVDDYKQVDYQGLYAFVGQAFIRQDKPFPAVGENPLLQPVAFKSVFGGDEMKTGPRLPGGESIAIPEIAKGQEYQVPPDRKAKTPGVLKFSPLRQLGESLPRGDNRAFARNIVNRMWWMMMGRGLVDPLDLSHSANPPSHPELLDLLADEMVAQQFDLKWLLRELALSQTYQRSGVFPAASGEVDTIPPTSYRVALERPLSPVQLLDSLLLATGEGAQLMGRDKTLEELRKLFDAAFASPPKEPEIAVNPTVKAALFLSNEQRVLAWFEPHEGNLVERLAQHADDGSVAEELYLSILSRRPTSDEAETVHGCLASHASARTRAIGQLAWALAASTEFFVNH